MNTRCATSLAVALTAFPAAAHAAASHAAASGIAELTCNPSRKTSDLTPSGQTFDETSNV